MDSKNVHGSVDGRFKKDDSSKRTKARKVKSHKKRNIIIAVIIVILLAAAAGVACYFIFFNQPAGETPEETAEAKDLKTYSTLTGEEIDNPGINTMPTYCMQIPNGNDGARPHVGLNEAGVVFEAIAEAGITRFAAVFQNPKSSAIGPIRSLRTYYLEWDTPFDCTIVHAGGAYDAIQRVAAGGYRDLSESKTYMWRDHSGYWAPNNLMTSANLLSSHSSDNNFTISNPKTFARLRPAEAEAAVKAAKEAASAEENATPIVKSVSVKFGNSGTYNTNYTYDEATNSYLRAYDNGSKHITYNCPSELEQPKPKADCGEPMQVAPKAVAVMMVDQWLDTDRYHQIVQAVGSGIAYVFQNGTAVKGTWTKNSVESQIVFKTEDGKEISFTPGQLWIAAVPNSTGSVTW